MRRTIIIIACALMPAILTWVAATIVPHFDGDKADIYGLATLMVFIIGTPLVLLTGSIFGFIVRNKPNFDRLFVYGYLVPAVLITLFAVISFLPNIEL